MMKITKTQLRRLIRQTIDESLSKNTSKIGKGLGAEFLYLLGQPIAVASANLPVPPIQVSPYSKEEEYDLDSAKELRKTLGVEPDAEPVEQFTTPHSSIRTKTLDDLEIEKDAAIWNK